MKIILSRKGFDSTSGGCPNPILPDGTLLSMPIPDDEAMKYSDLQYNGRTYDKILAGLNPGMVYDGCHLDPDIRENIRIRPIENWIPAFGQTGSALGILRNAGVTIGDLFLFFGIFRQTEYDKNGTLRFVREKNAIQIIHSYLQIGEILDTPAKIKKCSWHPHAAAGKYKAERNTVYLASMIGGIITPVGSSVNILALSLLENQTGVRVSFVQWMAMGLPVALVAIPVCWLLLKRLDVNVKLEKNEIEKILSELHQCEKTRSKDFRALLYIGIMLTFWIASSWVKCLNVIDITLIGCAVMCIPYIGVVKIDDVIEAINWKSVILLGSVLTIGTLLTRNNVFSLFECEAIRTASFHIPHFVLYIVTAFISFVLLIVIPVAPSMETFWIPFALSVFCSNGVNPALVTTIIAICACNCYLFPFDTVMLITYGSGYYSLKDLFKVSIPLQLCVVIACAAVVYLNELILW